MTYKEELKVMSNEELLGDLRFNTEHKLYKKRKDVETELLFRLNHDPMSENCGNCKYCEYEADMHKEGLCWNKKSRLYTTTGVNSTIRCTFWEGGEG